VEALRVGQGPLMDVVRMYEEEEEEDVLSFRSDHMYRIASVQKSEWLI